MSTEQVGLGGTSLLPTLHVRWLVLLLGTTRVAHRYVNKQNRRMTSRRKPQEQDACAWGKARGASVVLAGRSWVSIAELAALRGRPADRIPNKYVLKHDGLLLYCTGAGTQPRP